MCGVVGIANVSEPRPVSGDVLDLMNQAVRRRGPDDSGLHLADAAGIAMRRLSIIDLSGGHQPISNEDGSIHVVCNGEIYNYPELREQLLKKGHRFKTHSDVEVILHLYEDQGVRSLDALRGMFAFILWDEQKQKLFAARDRLGIKPLFHMERDGCLYLSSEIKSLLCVPSFRKEIDWGGFESFFTYGFIPAPETIFSGIKKLSAGHFLTLEKGNLDIQPYWSVRSKALHGNENELAAGFLDVFSKAVKIHLMSDVPLGAFLSGGIDSSLIVALMSQYSKTPVNTFTVGFGGQKGGFPDERNLAAMVSKRYGTRHTEYEVQPRIADILDEIVEAFDEPFADDSVIPSYYICKLTRQKVKVALTGLGGDELFGGYERYLGMKLSQSYARVPAWLRNDLINPLVNRLPELQNGHYTINHLKRFARSSSLHPTERYHEYISVFNDREKNDLFSESVRQAVSKEDRNDLRQYFTCWATNDVTDCAMSQDLNTYLPEDLLALSDRLSMYHSLELRVPFVDHEVVEFCAGIPARLKIKWFQKKYLLRKVAKPYLPEAIFTRRKQGFASPMTAWIRTDLKDYVRDTLSENSIAKHGFFNPQIIQKILQDHLNLKELNDKKIFALLMFQKWYEGVMAPR